MILVVVRMVVEWKTIHVTNMNEKFQIFIIVMTLTTSGCLKTFFFFFFQLLDFILMVATPISRCRARTELTTGFELFSAVSCGSPRFPRFHL